MNEEINSPYVSSESPSLAAGKLADDKWTVGILFFTPTQSCNRYFTAGLPLLKSQVLFVYGFIGLMRCVELKHPTGQGKSFMHILANKSFGCEVVHVSVHSEHRASRYGT